jgi:hypothetical protein
MTAHIQKTKFFIISVPKFKQYLSENCHFHILSYQIDIRLYLIMSYYFLFQFCNLAHPWKQTFTKFGAGNHRCWHNCSFPTYYATTSNTIPRVL